MYWKVLIAVFFDYSIINKTPAGVLLIGAASTSVLELSEIITNYQYEMIIWNKQVSEMANYSYAADPLPISY